MDRFLGPAPALPVALTTPIGTPGPVPRSGAPDSTQNSPAAPVGNL